MKQARIAAAAATAVVGAAAFAHSGATGVVLERMMGMSAMRDAMGALTPMMQGTAPYEVRTVQVQAATIMGHAGDTMTALFPADGDNAASFVEPEIWSEWEDFERMAAELRLYAQGLALAAPNGLRAPAGMPMSDGMAATAPEPEPPRLTVAQLMGVEPRPGARPVATTPDGAIDWSAMSAPAAFEMVGQICAACHARFRSGS